MGTPCLGNKHLFIITGTLRIWDHLVSLCGSVRSARLHLSNTELARHKSRDRWIANFTSGFLTHSQCICLLKDKAAQKPSGIRILGHRLGKTNVYIRWVIRVELKSFLYVGFWCCHHKFKWILRIASHLGRQRQRREWLRLPLSLFLL